MDWPIGRGTVSYRNFDKLGDKKPCRAAAFISTESCLYIQEIERIIDVRFLVSIREAEDCRQVREQNWARVATVDGVVPKQKYVVKCRRIT
jgi:hypothetical protein